MGDGKVIAYRPSQEKRQGFREGTGERCYYGKPLPGDELIPFQEFFRDHPLLARWIWNLALVAAGALVGAWIVL